jgi:hypothetical protein
MSPAARVDVLDALIGSCRVRGLGVQDEQGVDQLAVRLEIGLPDALARLADIVGRNLTWNSLRLASPRSFHRRLFVHSCGCFKRRTA